MMQRKNVLIVGEVYSENLGDGIIYQAISNRIKVNFKNIDIDNLDLSGNLNWVEEDTISRLPDIISNERLKLISLIKKVNFAKKIFYTYQWYFKKRKECINVWEDKIKKADHILLGGGQLLTDSNFGFPPKIFDIYLLCKKHNKPLSIIGCGVGKKWGKIATYIYKKVLNYSNDISVRDEVSKERLYSFTGKSAVIHPDVGFSIVECTKDLKNSSNSHHDLTLESHKKKKLFINFQPLNDFKFFVPSLSQLTESEYFDFWHKIIDECSSAFDISLITNGHPSDYNVMLKFYNEMKDNGFEKLSIYERATRPEQLMMQLNECDCIISTRMHAGIVSYSLGKKVIPISWDDKVNNVWFEMTKSNDIVLEPNILITGLTIGDIELKLNKVAQGQNDNIISAIEKIDEYVISLFIK